MANVAEEREQTSVETVDTAPIVVQAIPTTTDQPPTTSLVQSLLQEQTDETGDKKKKKKKKAKTGRQKELERLVKATKTIFASPEKLNAACKRIDALLSDHKVTLLSVCHTLDKSGTGFLTYEQFRLILKDRVPSLSKEDVFIVTKLFEIEGGLIDYRAILSLDPNSGILQHVTALAVPPAKEIVLEKKPTKELRQPFNEPIRLNHPKYVTVHLRLITFDSYNAYPGHIRLTVPDHMSVYALSKMVIEETDLPTLSVDIFREKIRSRHALLDPMRTLEDQNYVGAYVDGTHQQPFPTYTLYYDYSPLNMRNNCPILKCDYYMK